MRIASARPSRSVWAFTPTCTLAIFAAAAAAVFLSPVGHAQQTFNGGAITVTSTQTTASSSTATVSGVSAAVETVQVTLNGVNTDGATGSLQDADVWLTAPGGQELVLLGATGTGTDTLSGATITISDAASSAAPNDTTAWTAGTFRPGSYWFSNDLTPPYGTSNNWPQSDGSATLTSIFYSAVPNGTWTLNIQNFNHTTPISISSWSLVLTYAPQLTTTTSLSTNAANHETTEGTSVTLTATVSTPTETVNEGTVTFSDGGNPITCNGGAVPVSSGEAMCDAIFETEGVHPLEATYNGTTDLAGSTSPVVNLFVDHKTTNPIAGEYCNTGGISISGSLSGSNNPASPYPSHIDVTGYSGTITGATLTLNGFTDADPEETVMALAGPTGTNIVPWNDVGGSTAVSNISFTLADSAGPSNTIPSPPDNGETYFPTANTSLGAAAFPAGTAPWGPPGTPSYAAPEGTGTFTSTFSGVNPNGYWSLYLYNRSSKTALSATGWCIDLLSQPTMSVTKTHSGSFTQGDTADTYTITVTNNGPVSSSGGLTVSDTLPVGMSAVSFAETAHSGGGTGSDWSCSGTSCTRNTAMSSGEQDTLTLTVSVGYTTPTGTNAVTNSVTVSGGNASNSPTATDPTTINAGPTEYTLTTSANPSAGGMVSPASGTYGGVVNLSASPNTGWAFTNWTGNVANANSASTTITMNAAESATANFAPSGQTTAWIVNSVGGLSELTSTGAPVTTTPYTGGNTAVAIDATGNLWTLNSSSPLLLETNQLGTEENSFVSGTGGPAAPVSVAIDGGGQVWVVNSGGSVSLFSNAGAVLSPSAGFTDPSLKNPNGIAIDLGGSVWIANQGNNTITRILGAGAPAAPLSTAVQTNKTGARP